MAKREDVPVCETQHTHDDVVDKVKHEMPGEDELYDLADLFKTFGDSTRIRILYALFETELCVCDIVEALGMSQSAISHQLRILKQAKLVKYRREGKMIYYSLDDDHVKMILGQGMDHVLE